MLRKIFRLIRNLLIGALWTYVFLFLISMTFLLIWNFNFFSARSWQTITAFWQAGGTIKTGSDYVFLLALISVPFIWIWGLGRLIRVNYLNILLWPVMAYNRRIINKYGHESCRIILKNLKSSQEQIEAVKQKLESIQPGKPREVHNIRDEIQKKLESSQK